MIERSIIQKTAGDFLKNYYKSRPRDSEGVTTYEQALDINLVAGGCHFCSSRRNAIYFGL